MLKLKNRSKIACFLLAIFIILLLFTFTVELIGHDCTGEHCNICQSIYNLMSILKLVAFSMLLYYFTQIIAKKIYQKTYVYLILIFPPLYKVRMDN